MRSCAIYIPLKLIALNHFITFFCHLMQLISQNLDILTIKIVRYYIQNIQIIFYNKRKDPSGAMAGGVFLGSLNDSYVLVCG